MIMRHLWFLAALACAMPAVAQLEYADDATKAKCEQNLQTPLPADASAIPVPKQWPECNSYKLYSGIGTKVDYAAARRCAWSERLAQKANLEPRYSVASVFGGSAMLSVLFADGEGVPQDLELAAKFACEAGGAPAEIRIRLDHVASLAKTQDPSKPKFNFCDDITSGFMEGFCAAYGSELQDQERSNSLKSITSSFNSEQHQLFNSLLKVEEAYAEAHARGEIDTSGTARAMYQIDAEDTLRDDFIDALRTFEAGKSPSGSQADYAEADEKLNAAFRNAMSSAQKSKNNYGTVQPDGIRNSERVWLKYRDAFVAFTKARYPEVSPAAWLTLLTKTRTSILDGSFCEMDDVEGPCAQQGDRWKPSPLP